MAYPCAPSADSVLVIDNCPTNPSEWKERALQKNCSEYPQTCFKPLEYHCLLNPYGNESLEVCAPNTWLDKRKFFAFNAYSNFRYSRKISLDLEGSNTFYSYVKIMLWWVRMFIIKLSHIEQFLPES